MLRYYTGVGVHQSNSRTQYCVHTQREWHSTATWGPAKDRHSDQLPRWALHGRAVRPNTLLCTPGNTTVGMASRYMHLAMASHFRRARRAARSLSPADYGPAADHAASSRASPWTCILRNQRRWTAPPRSSRSRRMCRVRRRTARAPRRQRTTCIRADGGSL